MPEKHAAAEVRQSVKREHTDFYLHVQVYELTIHLHVVVVVHVTIKPRL